MFEGGELAVEFGGSYAVRALSYSGLRLVKQKITFLNCVDTALRKIIIERKLLANFHTAKEMLLCRRSRLDWP